MHRLKILGLALTAVFAVAVAVSASASAATPMTLPEFITKTTWKGESGKGKLVATGQEIKCETGTNAGGMEASKKLGTFTITFNECKSSLFSAKCNSEGDATEVILTTGSWHIVLVTKGGKDFHLLWLLIKPLTVVCGGGLATINVRGNVLGQITGLTLTKKYPLLVNVNSANQQEYTSFENDSGELVKASLESSLNGGKFEPATEESQNNILTTELDTLIIN